MSRFVAVSVRGVVQIHLPDTSGNYATLCGLDGNDDAPDIQQTTVPVPKRKKIDCPDCKNIWALAKQYRAADFED